MKRFFLLIFISIFIPRLSFGQNLIPNPSVEDYIECPDGLGGDPPHDIDHWVVGWKNLRGSSDYFRDNCLSDLGWHNFAGYQLPRTGNAYLGLATYHTGLVNAREIVGVELNSPLLIGETYYLSFFVSTAFSPTFVLTSNRIGALLMCENYLNTGEGGVLPNLSTYSEQEIITDTANWVSISTIFIADSAYRFIAFGNFYDDEMTDTLRLDSSIGGAVSYYYFDDFCLSTDSNECEISTSVPDISVSSEILLFPNPASDYVRIKSSSQLKNIEVYNLIGQLQSTEQSVENNKANIEFDLSSGIYFVNISTTKGVYKKRFVVQ